MKISKTKISLFLLFTLFFLLTTFAVASAAGLVPCGECKKWDTAEACIEVKECTVCDLFVGIHNIVDFLLLKITIPLATIAIMYGGFMMLTSGGSEDKVKKGKTALTMAIWGIVIAFAGWLIVDTILGGLVDGIFLRGFWNKFPDC